MIANDDIDEGSMNQNMAVLIVHSSDNDTVKIFNTNCNCCVFVVIHLEVEQYKKLNGGKRILKPFAILYVKV